MAYDYHGSWNQRTGHNSPLFARNEQTGDQLTLNQEASVNAWIELGAPAEKLVLGLAMYGRTFTLKTKKMNGMNAPASDAGKAGPYTQAAGFLSYFEVCKLLKDGWNKEWHDEQKIPYAFKDDQWVGYDDPQSIKIKVSSLKYHYLSILLAVLIILNRTIEQYTNFGLINTKRSRLLVR